MTPAQTPLDHWNSGPHIPAALAVSALIGHIKNLKRQKSGWTATVKV